MQSISTQWTSSSWAARLTRLLQPLSDQRTYRNIAFLLLRLPLGIAYFMIFTTGLVLGASLTPVLVGLPILAITLGLGHYAGSVEAAVVRRLLGTEVTHTPRHDPRKEPLETYLKGVLTDTQSYLLIAYFVAALFVGIGTFTFIVTVFSVGIALAVAPLVYPFPISQYAAPNVVGSGWVVVDTLPEALATSLVGFGILLVGAHVSNTLGSVHGRITAAVLNAN